MLCAFSKVEKVKIEKFVKSFADAVDILQGGFGFLTGGGVKADTPSGSTGLRETLGPLIRQLVEIRDRFGLQHEVTFALSTEGLVIQVSETPLFDRGVAEISPKAFPLLNMIADIISKSAYNVRVEGHTDNLPIHTAEFPSNWELSTTRAVNVLRYLIDKGKCSPKRLSAAGFAGFQPIFPNDTAEHRARNRRVELVLVPEE